jgi:hypothetical protein
VSPDHRDLAQVLSYPACVFDQPFVSAPHARLLDQYDELLDGNRHLERLYHDALTSYETLHAEYENLLEGSERLQSLYDEAIEAYGLLEAMYDSAIEAHARQGELLETAAADNRSLADEVAAGEQERARLGEAIASMDVELQELRRLHDARAELERVRNSISWRVTAPLRTVRSRVPSWMLGRSATT